MHTYFLTSIMCNLMSSPTASSLRKRAAAPLLYSIGVYWEHLSYLVPCYFRNPTETQAWKNYQIFFTLMWCCCPDTSVWGVLLWTILASVDFRDSKQLNRKLDSYNLVFSIKIMPESWVFEFFCSYKLSKLHRLGKAWRSLYVGTCNSNLPLK